MNNVKENILNKLENFHLAGIIPLSGFEIQGSNVGMTHIGLSPLSDTLLAVERAVIECNYAGCETIWIVCNEDYQPLLRHRVKDSTTSMYSLSSSRFAKFPQTKLRQIPIFYVPIPATLRGKRDSLGWSILHGALQAFTVCTKISKWLVPNKYFVSSPYGVHDPKLISAHKKKLFSTHNLFLSFEKKTVSHGLNTSFTFRPEDYIKIKKNIKNICTGSTKKPYWSSRNFTIDKFFNCDIIDNVNEVQLDHYYSLTNWGEYKAFISSKESHQYDKYSLQKLNHQTNERILYENE